MNFHYRNSDMLNVYLLLALNPVVRELIPLLLQEWVKQVHFGACPTQMGFELNSVPHQASSLNIFTSRMWGFYLKDYGLWFLGSLSEESIKRNALQITSGSITYCLNQVQQFIGLLQCARSVDGCRKD